MSTLGRRAGSCPLFPVPLSHPFVERLNGTIRRECLDRTLFWSTSELEGKLSDFAVFYNESRTHASLAGKPPGGNPERVASLKQYGWRAHCRGLYQTPIALWSSNMTACSA